MIDSPIFCLTCDIDWASEYCIEDFITLALGYGIKPTLFATHQSKVLDKFMIDDKIELGIHPNFLPDSSHGTDYLSVIDKLISQFPGVECFRSHGFFDNSIIIQKMMEHGIKYDSNICLYLQPNIVPLNQAVGITRFPVFWEDDSHWNKTDGNWNINTYLNHFLTPGLKILNFHPFNVAVNIPNEPFYQQVKQNSSTLTAIFAEQIKFSSKGVRTFLVELLDKLLSSGYKFYTLKQLYEMFPIDNFISLPHETKGRETCFTDEDYKNYWEMNDHQKQEFLKKIYSQRNAKDKYATSRDFNLRELEISCIEKCIDGSGSILDLGCGNGYTLLSLAKKHDDCNMIGIDFSENLIEGANYLLNDERERLKSIPNFICADALIFIKNIKSNSINYIIMERFIQNLPSEQFQKEILLEAYRVLSPGGRLLMCEGSKAGHDLLNNLREAVGLESIPATSKDNISAIRIEDDIFEGFLQEEVGFKLIGKYGFSDYFIMSRVLHPLLISPLKPQFHAKINELARKIQEQTQFRVGYGSNVLWVLQK